MTARTRGIAIEEIMGILAIIGVLLIVCVHYSSPNSQKDRIEVEAYATSAPGGPTYVVVKTTKKHNNDVQDSNDYAFYSDIDGKLASVNIIKHGRVIEDINESSPRWQKLLDQFTEIKKRAKAQTKL
jgi:hypothetical protein